MSKGIEGSFNDFTSPVEQARPDPGEREPSVLLLACSKRQLNEGCAQVQPPSQLNKSI